MDILFNEIEERLMDQVPELKRLDWDFGQLSLEKPPVSWPCCLIDFPTVQYSNEGRLVQLGDTTITLRFGFKVYERATSHTPKIYKDIALEHLTILKKAQQALHGWENEHFSALNRTGFKRTPSIKNRQYLITYNTTIYDNSGSKVLRKVPRPNFEIE